MTNQKTVFITGASSGIGESCARQFAAMGYRLILTARRIEKLQVLAENLRGAHGIQVVALQLDVRRNEDVVQIIQSLAAEWQNIDILINNAGLALSTDKIQDADPQNWDTMIDTNVKGLLYMTRAILPGMIARNCGHIINIGSIAGHEYYSGGNIYCATKHAVKAITRTLRIDLLGSAIRVSEIDPGAVHTEFSEVRWGDKHRADAFYADFAALSADDIARSVVFCTIQPPHVNIAEIKVMPTAQASAHHLSRTGEASSIGMFR